MLTSFQKAIVSAVLVGSTSLAPSAELSRKSLSKPDPVVLRFSTIGDSRQDPVNFDPSVGPLNAEDKIWLQNSKAWSRILREVAAQKSQILLFNGDMIMGYGKAGPAASNSVEDVVGSDLMAFYKQYAYWRGMVATLMTAGTYVVPVAGNHEVQSKAAGKKAQVENENAWRANMGDLIVDADRFKSITGKEAAHIDVQNNAAKDELTTDQSQLSYSFDVEDQHFAIINTDPVGRDNVAPTSWLAADLEKAKARGAKHLFVFGHKPAFTYVYHKQSKKTEAAGLDKYPTQRDAFWDVVEQYGATYFCGHEHMFNMMQPRGAAWQILVGTAGSPWDAQPGEETLSPSTDRSYIWATVDVHKSGAVDVSAWGFDENFGKTKLFRRIQIAR